MYAIPYTFVPLINLFVGYGMIASGILPAPNGASILGMPIPIFFTGLVLGSIGLGFLQVGLLALDTAIYYPFFRAEDRKFFKEEQELAKQAPKDSVQPTTEVKAPSTTPRAKKV
jgi:PTS system cellobiose-specific IIC component